MYHADDTEHTFAWMQYIQKFADPDAKIDWTDLEERAHFLNMLYVWCESMHIAFPFEIEREEGEKF